jgi:hypothetical protein
MHNKEPSMVQIVTYKEASASAQPDTAGGEAAIQQGAWRITILY